jgi:hypothetical protein
MKVILAATRRQKKISLAVASSVIAATLLPGGKTVHLMFKVSIENPNAQICNISKNSELARILRDCSLIIWDEC